MKRSKSIFGVIALLALSVGVLAGCHNDEPIPDTPIPDETDPNPEIVEPGPVDEPEDDDTWSESWDEHHNGLPEDQDRHDGHIDHSEDYYEDEETHEIKYIYLHEGYKEVYDEENNEYTEQLIFTHEGEDGDHSELTLEVFEEEYSWIHIYVRTERGLRGALSLVEALDEAIEESSGTLPERTEDIRIEIEHDLEMWYLEYTDEYTATTHSDGVAHTLVITTPHVKIEGADHTEDKIIVHMCCGIKIAADNVTIENITLDCFQYLYNPNGGAYNDYYNGWSASTYIKVIEGDNILLKDIEFKGEAEREEPAFAPAGSELACVKLTYKPGHVTIDGMTTVGWFKEGVVAEYLASGAETTLEINNSDISTVIWKALSIRLNYQFEYNEEAQLDEIYDYSQDGLAEKDPSAGDGFIYGSDADNGFPTSFALEGENSRFFGICETYTHGFAEVEGTAITTSAKWTTCYFGFHHVDHKDRVNGRYESDIDTYFDHCTFENLTYGLDYGVSNDNLNEEATEVHRYLFGPSYRYLEDSRGDIVPEYRLNVIFTLDNCDAIRYDVLGDVHATTKSLRHENIGHHITEYWWLPLLEGQEEVDSDGNLLSGFICLDDDDLIDGDYDYSVYFPTVDEQYVEH